MLANFAAEFTSSDLKADSYVIISGMQKPVNRCEIDSRKPTKRNTVCG